MPPRVVRQQHVPHVWPVLPAVWRYEAVRVPGRLLYQQDAMSVLAIVLVVVVGYLIVRGLTR